MVEPLEKRHTNSAVCRWINFMLNHRTATAEMYGYSRGRKVQRGCPQGGILSPLLWNLVMDELLQIFPCDGPVYAQAYADDLSLVVTGLDPSTLGDLMQEALKKLETWANHHSLQFVPSKTEIVMFTKKRKFTLPNLYLYNTKLNWSNQVKYLGLILDSKLSWTPHCNSRIKKATIALAQCRRALGATWGLSPKIMMWLYCQVIRPTLTYVSVVWINCTYLKTVQVKLSQVQRLACVSITSAFPGTPTSALEVFLNIPPLHLFIRGVAVRTAHRLISLGQWKGKNYNIGHKLSHIDICNRLIEEIPILQLPVDRTRQTLSLDKISITIPDRNNYVPPICPPEDSVTLQCFTDGSRFGGSSGCGFVIWGSDVCIQHGFPLGSYPSVFQAEVMGLIELTSGLDALNTRDKIIHIHCDSQASLKALSKTLQCSKIILECKAGLQKLAEHNTVNLMWIPAHSSYEGNERADMLAGSGSRSQYCGPQPAIPIPMQSCIRDIQNWISTQHCKEWTMAKSCRQAKLFLPCPDKALASELLSLSRWRLRSVLQIMSGHGNLARHRYITKQCSTPICPLCGIEEETPLHHVGKCPTLRRVRFKWFNEFELTLEQIKALPVQKLASFLKEAGSLDKFN